MAFTMQALQAHVVSPCVRRTAQPSRRCAPVASATRPEQPSQPVRQLRHRSAAFAPRKRQTWRVSGGCMFAAARIAACSTPFQDNALLALLSRVANARRRRFRAARWLWPALPC